MYQCEYCDKCFKNQHGLKYHLEKRVCQKEKYKCEKCGKVLADRSGLIYHRNNKVCENKKSTIKKTCTLKGDFLDKYENYSKEELLYELSKFSNNDQISVNGNNNVTNTCNNNVTNNVTYNVTNITNNILLPEKFGTENFEYILDKCPNLLHDAITQYKDHRIAYLTKKVHCNKLDFPEYMNVYIKGYKSALAVVFDGVEFIHQYQNEIIDQLIDKFTSLLQSYLDDNFEKYGQKIFERYEKYQNSLEISEGEKKTPVRKNTEIEIKTLLLEIKPVIESDLKKKMQTQPTDVSLCLK